MIAAAGAGTLHCRQAATHTIAIDLDRIRSILEESGCLCVPKASKAGGCWADDPLLPSSATEEGCMQCGLVCPHAGPPRQSNRWLESQSREPHHAISHVVNSSPPRSHRAPEREGSVCEQQQQGGEGKQPPRRQREGGLHPASVQYRTRA